LPVIIRKEAHKNYLRTESVDIYFWFIWQCCPRGQTYSTECYNGYWI